MGYKIMAASKLSSGRWEFVLTGGGHEFSEKSSKIVHPGEPTLLDL